MGLYDRDYYREEQRPGLTLRAPQSVVLTLIIVNAVLFLINGIVWPDTNDLTRLLSVSDRTLTRPWLWWQFLTYGFAHADIWHVFFNMLQLWFLGRVVEQLYGQAEFLRLYLVMILLGSLAFVLAKVVARDPNPYILLGASGAVSGVVMLFVLNYPNQTLLLFPIPIPIKAWVIGVLLVASNIWGSIQSVGNTAFGVHLVGIAFAYLYVRNRWNLRWLSFDRLRMPNLRRGPRLKVHHPGKDEEDLSSEVDRILEKIHREGEASLTRGERRTLETASRKYQSRRE